MTDKEIYIQNKVEIDAALNGRTGILPNPENQEDVFYMLLFCLCVPQSRAVEADKAIIILREKDFLHKDFDFEIKVRFQNVKKQRLIDAKKKFNEVWQEIRLTYVRYMTSQDKFLVLREFRKYLINNVNGMGYKVASHFIRNTGMNNELAILDVHIIKAMKKRGLLEENFKLSIKNYEEVEDKFREYAVEQSISVDALDLLYWREATGYVFK